MRACPTCAVEYCDETYGASFYCRPCMAARAKARRAKNPEESRAKSLAWRRANPDRVSAWNARNRAANLEGRRAYRKAAYAANREHELAQGAAYKRDNPERIAGYTRRRLDENPEYNRHARSLRRAREKQAVPRWANRSKILAVFREARRLTEETGVVHHVDHVVPLQSKFVCGLHWHGNLQVLRATDNLAKLNRYDPDTPLAMGI